MESFIPLADFIHYGH